MVCSSSKRSAPPGPASTYSDLFQFSDIGTFSIGLGAVKSAQHCHCLLGHWSVRSELPLWFEGALLENQHCPTLMVDSLHKGSRISLQETHRKIETLDIIFASWNMASSLSDRILSLMNLSFDTKPKSATQTLFVTHSFQGLSCTIPVYFREYSNNTLL